MKTSNTVAVLSVVLVFACGKGGHHAANSSPDALQSADGGDGAPLQSADGGDPTMPRPVDLGPPPPPASDEEMQHLMECRELGDAAESAFAVARTNVEIDQCRTTGDCAPPPLYWPMLMFNSSSSGCWETCGLGLAGTKEYVDSLRAIASEQCQEFYAKQCVVIPSSCGAPVPGLPAPTWGCVEGQCVRQ
jgi:hypothetical protein